MRAIVASVHAAPGGQLGEVGQNFLDDILTATGSVLKPVSKGHFKGGVRSSGVTVGSYLRCRREFQVLWSQPVILFPSRPPSGLSSAADLQRFVGDTLRQVIIFGAEDATEGRHLGGDSQEVDLAIILNLSASVIRIDWSILGDGEGLVLAFEEGPPPSWESRDVSGSPVWSDAIGQELLSCSFASHDAPFGTVESIVGIRLDFESGSRAVVVGELDGSTIRYHPEWLVATTDLGEVDRYLNQMATSWNPV